MCDLAFRKWLATDMGSTFVDWETFSVYAAALLKNLKGYSLYRTVDR